MSAAAEPVLSDDLKRLLERKRSLEDELQAVERRIFKLEESYIAETMSVGNVIRGWDGYLSTKNAGMYKSISRRAHVKDNDRMFTQSSATGFPVCLAGGPLFCFAACLDAGLMLTRLSLAERAEQRSNGGGRLYVTARAHANRSARTLTRACRPRGVHTAQMTARRMAGACNARARSV